MKSSSPSFFYLVPILVTGAAMRFLGISFGLPNTFARPDEQFIISLAMNLGSGDLNPHFFGYPSLYLYVLFIAFGIYFYAGKLIGRFASMDDFIAEYAIDPSNFHLIDRSISALSGTATILVVWLLANRLFKRKTANLAALIFACSYLPVRDAHFGTTDTFLVLLISVAMLFLVHYFQKADKKYLILGGLFSGLAMSTKYSGLILVFPAFIAISYVVKRNRSAIKFAPNILLFSATLILGFILGTPYSLLDFSNFIASWNDIGQIMTEHGIKMQRGYIHHLMFSLRYGFGFGLLALCLIPLFTESRQNITKYSILLSFPLFYYLITGWGYTIFLRYTLPLFPFLAILSARGMILIWEKTKEKAQNKYSMTFIAIILFLALVPSVFRIAKLDFYLLKDDNRLMAEKFVNTNFQFTSIFQFDGGARFARLQLEESLPCIDEKIRAAHSEGRNAKGLLAKKNFFKSSDQPEFGSFDSFNEKERFVKKPCIEDSEPELIIIHDYPILDLKHPTPALKNLIESDYHLVREFIALDTINTKNEFDHLDAFFLPFAGFEGVRRPGPNIRIYQKRMEQDIN